MELTDDDKRVLDERNFPEKLKEMIEDMPKDDIMKIHDFAEYVLIKERVSKADMKSSEKLTDKEISEIAEKGSFDGKMTEHIDYAKETDYLIAGYKWKRDNGLNEKKYELTDETIKRYGHTLHRIIALRDFGDVEEGDLGGFIECEENLSHEGNCWVCDKAIAFSNAKVYGDARVYGEAVVRGNAKVFENAEVFDSAEVYESAQVFGNAQVTGRADVFSQAKVYGNAKVYENAEVSGNALVCAGACVYGDAKVYGKALVYDFAQVYGNASVYENAVVKGNAEIGGWGTVKGNAEISEGKISRGTIDGKVKKNIELD